MPRWTARLIAAVFVMLWVGCQAGAASSAAATPARFPFHLPSSGTLLIIGDSWSCGYDARPLTDGYAFLLPKTLGLTGEVHCASGTGYVNSGTGWAKGRGNYGQRLAALPPSEPALVLVQGSYNDLKYPASTIESAERRTLAAFKAKYPRAQIVVFGPGDPDPGREWVASAGSRSLAQLDRLTEQAAAAERLNYISMIQEHWFTTANKARVLTTRASPHPTNFGHRVLNVKLAADLRKLSS